MVAYRLSNNNPEAGYEKRNLVGNGAVTIKRNWHLRFVETYLGEMVP